MWGRERTSNREKVSGFTSQRLYLPLYCVGVLPVTFLKSFAK